MGEMMHITTIPNQENIFYKNTSGSLRFQVKGPGYAGIGLTEKPTISCDFWIVLGPNISVIMRGGNTVDTKQTPHILNIEEYREFWLQWHNNTICMGRKNSVNPFIVHKTNTCDLQYVTFGVVDNSRVTLEWRFELPPLLPTIGIKPISGGVPRWVSADSQLPDGALTGGYENEILYIIRAEHRGSLTPGKFVPSLGLGFIPWGGEMHEISEFEVLCGYNCIWIPSSDGKLPAGAVEAGHSETQGNERLYVGRCLWNNQKIPGKVQPSHNVCYIPYDGREIANKEYEVLVVPDNNIQCSNKYFMYDLMNSTCNDNYIDIQDFDEDD